MNIRSLWNSLAFAILLPLILCELQLGCGSEATYAPDATTIDSSSQSFEKTNACTWEPLRGAPELCNGSDDNCDGYIDRDLLMTDCAKLLIEYVGIVARTQAAQGDLTTRSTPLGCPPERGMGEAQLNVFSYIGPLPKYCNRLIRDDCNDPERQNYWVAVTADRRQAASHSYQVNWGTTPNDYSYYANCVPEGFDGPGSRIPKRLIPIRDANGDGVMDKTCLGSQVAWVGFATTDPTGSQEILIKDIADVVNLRQTSKNELDLSPVDLEQQLYTQDNLAVDIRSPGNAGTWTTARLRISLGPSLLKWKESLVCE